MNPHEFHFLLNSCMEEHEDYMEILNNHIGSEYYADIIDFLDIRFPEWNRYKNLGHNAPEFILAIISITESNKGTSVKKLEYLYEEIDDNYLQYTNTFPSCNDMSKCENFMEEINIDVNDPNFDAIYDKEYDDFMAKLGNTIPYILHPKEYFTLVNSIITK